MIRVLFVFCGRNLILVAKFGNVVSFSEDNRFQENRVAVLWNCQQTDIDLRKVLIKTDQIELNFLY